MSNECDKCDRCLTQCMGVKQTIGSFSFRSEDIEKDSSFLTSDEWNSLIQHIYEGYSMEANYNYSLDEFSLYQGKDIRAGAEYSNEFMSANMFNGILAKMKFLTGNGSDLPITSYNDGNKKAFGPQYPSLKKMIPDVDIVYAEYFKDLEEYANNLELPEGCYGDCLLGEGEYSCCHTPAPCSESGGCTGEGECSGQCSSQGPGDCYETGCGRE